jgi:hypothetical protein
MTGLEPGGGDGRTEGVTGAEAGAARGFATRRSCIRGRLGASEKGLPERGSWPVGRAAPGRPAVWPPGPLVRARAARVGSLGEVGGVRIRLDHAMVRVPLDLLLELGNHMAGRDDETAWVDTHGLVLSPTKCDEPIAAKLPAFASGTR